MMSKKSESSGSGTASSTEVDEKNETLVELPNQNDKIEETSEPESKKIKMDDEKKGNPDKQSSGTDNSSNKREIRRREERRRARYRSRSYSRSRSPSRDKELNRYWGGRADDEHYKNQNYKDRNARYVGNRYYGGADRSDYRRRNDRNKRRGQSLSKSPDSKNEEISKEIITERQRKTVDLLTSKTGGAYIPPAKLRLLQAEITDKSSAAYQRISWEALKKSIHGHINKVNVDNIGVITRQLIQENIIRGRGLLSRSIIQAQAASPTFSHVYAALVSVINSKFPNIGELLLQRLVIQFKRGFRRNDKSICLSSSRFIAHLVNQRVAHEILALEILTLLVERPTDDSVEVAIAFLKECGQKLTEVSGKGINAIFEMLKNILHEGKLEKRVQYMIEVVFQVRKDGFKDHIAVIDALELVEEDDQFTHLIMLDEAQDTQDILNVFKFDPEYEINEEKYNTLSKELLGSDADDSDDDGSGDGSGDSDDSDEDDNEEDRDEDGVKKSDVIIDNTETNLVALRRTIYLTIHSSLDYEECAHKLMKMELKPGQESELCHMFLDCCAEQRTYEKFYGLLAQRFCMINKTYIEPFEEIFKDTYSTTHRLDTNRLRNVSKFFAHLLFTDSIGWQVFECIKLNEEDTTSSSRIFIKILFQELAEYMGMIKFNARLKDITLQQYFSGLFPRDNPKNTRFAINFFTSIGLGGLTDELREFLKTAPKMIVPTPEEAEQVDSDSSSSSSSSSSTSSSSSGSSSSSSSSSTESSDSSSGSDSSAQKRRKSKKKKAGKSHAKSKENKKAKKKNEKKKSASDSDDIQKNKDRNLNRYQKGRNEETDRYQRQARKYESPMNRDDDFRRDRHNKKANRNRNRNNDDSGEEDRNGRNRDYKENYERDYGDKRNNNKSKSSRKDLYSQERG